MNLIIRVYNPVFTNVNAGPTIIRLIVRAGNESGSGGTEWGDITGTLSDQADLQAALDAKEGSLGYTPENVANKSTDVNLGSSNTLYPSQLAVKTYVDASAGGVQSVTGLNTDNTDPENPIVRVSVDGVTITGLGTPGSPLISSGGGLSESLAIAYAVALG